MTAHWPTSRDLLLQLVVLCPQSGVALVTNNGTMDDRGDFQVEKFIAAQDGEEEEEQDDSFLQSYNFISFVLV